MTSFEDLFGPQLGPWFEMFWPYLWFGCVGLLLWTFVGIGKIIGMVIKQLVVMFLMAVCGMIWWVLVSSHWNTVDLKALAAAMTNWSNTKENLKTNRLFDPLSEIVLATGLTLFLMGLLYRQLPVDLIPDCIPCIGKYDNMFAGFVAFVGLIIAAFGVYFQLNYSDGPNSTTMFIQSVTNYASEIQDFQQKQSGNPWETFVELAKQYMQISQNLIVRSLEKIHQQIEERLAKKK